MAKVQKVSEKIGRNSEPSFDPDAREKQMIALAVKCAEKQLREGTASSQLIVHYLKLATKREKLEEQLLEKQAAVAEAKAESYQSAKDLKELYADAITAMKRYSGQSDVDEQI